MLILALDTATERGSLALVAADRLLLEYSLESPGAYLTSLLPGVEALLQASGRRLEEVGAIAVSQGPGNFTGLRIGLATAKGLAWALTCPLVPVPTLEVLAAQCPLSARTPSPCSWTPSGKKSSWACSAARRSPRRLTDPLRLPVSDLPARLQPPPAPHRPGA